MSGLIGQGQGVSIPLSSPLSAGLFEAASGNGRPNDGSESNSGGVPAQAVEEGKFDEPEEYHGPTRAEFKKMVEDNIVSLVGRVDPASSTSCAAQSSERGAKGRCLWLGEIVLQAR